MKSFPNTYPVDFWQRNARLEGSVAFSDESSFAQVGEAGLGGSYNSDEFMTVLCEPTDEVGIIAKDFLEELVSPNYETRRFLGEKLEGSQRGEISSHNEEDLGFEDLEIISWQLTHKVSLSERVDLALQGEMPVEENTDPEAYKKRKTYPWLRKEVVFSIGNYIQNRDSGATFFPNEKNDPFGAFKNSGIKSSETAWVLDQPHQWEYLPFDLLASTHKVCPERKKQESCHFLGQRFESPVEALPEGLASLYSRHIIAGYLNGTQVECMQTSEASLFLSFKENRFQDNWQTEEIENFKRRRRNPLNPWNIFYKGMSVFCGKAFDEKTSENQRAIELSGMSNRVHSYPKRAPKREK
jgi:hypothetical protein